MSCIQAKTIVIWSIIIRRNVQHKTKWSWSTSIFAKQALYAIVHLVGPFLRCVPHAHIQDRQGQCWSQGVLGHRNKVWRCDLLLFLSGPSTSLRSCGMVP
jgi:hypothetical protein